MTDKLVQKASLTEQVAQNAASFASNMYAVWPEFPAEVIARSTMAFTEAYLAYWIRQVEAGTVSFMDTDLPDSGDTTDD